MVLPCTVRWSLEGTTVPVTTQAVFLNQPQEAVRLARAAVDGGLRTHPSVLARLYTAEACAHAIAQDARRCAAAPRLADRPWAVSPAMAPAGPATSPGPPRRHRHALLARPGQADTGAALRSRRLDAGRRQRPYQGATHRTGRHQARTTAHTGPLPGRPARPRTYSPARTPAAMTAPPVATTQTGPPPPLTDHRHALGSDAHRRRSRQRPALTRSIYRAAGTWHAYP